MLDNPIWAALTTEQVRFAERDGDVARFAPDVTALAGLRVQDASAFAALGRMLGDRAAGVLLDEPYDLGALAVVARAPCAQMIFEGAVPVAEPFEELGSADAPAMLALAEATRPGPFSTRTRELGTFLGVRDDVGALIAMAGQRMRLPGLVEISGVCTDPAHLGRGHAARLIQAQLARILAIGAGVFLHVKADNARAIALYERLGFRHRRTFDYVIVRAQPG